MSKVKLQQLLSSRLALRGPVFRLERIGQKLAGSVVSETFRNKDASQRQKMVWDAIEAELGGEAPLEVGTLLLYSPEEWDIDLPSALKAKAG
jgi:acid stress-induced BolA-like protein IbaG/YrbA